MAVDFDGTDGYIDCGAVGDLDISAPNYTVGAVFKVDNVGGGINGVLVGTRADSDVDDNLIAIQLDHNEDDCRMIVRDGDGNAAVATASATLDTTEWHAAVGVRDGTTVYVYVDDSNANGSNGSIGGDISTAKTIIGNFWQASTNSIGNAFFNGKIAEVFICEGSWTQAQAQEWINAKLKYHAYQHNGSAWVRGGYWPLDDLTSGTSINGQTFADRRTTHPGTGSDAGGESVGYTEEVLTYPVSPIYTLTTIDYDSHYTRGNYDSLPSDIDDLETRFSPADYTTVSSDNASRVSQSV